MVFMKVNLEILKKMDKGNIILIIKILTKANGKMIKRKEKEYIFMKIIICTMVIG